MTTPAISQHKSSPTFRSEGGGLKRHFVDHGPHSSALPDFGGASYTHDSEYHVKAHSSDILNHTSRERHSFDNRRYSTNAYAASTTAYTHSCHSSDPYYPYPRPRANTSPTGYHNGPTYSSHYPSYYSPPNTATHSPHVFRGSIPPTPQDRKRAHILSEQKRRESINAGYADLSQRLISEHLMRALSMCCQHSNGYESNPKFVFDNNTILGGDRKNSKAVLLQKAVKAIDRLSASVIELSNENAMLRGLSQDSDKNAMNGDHTADYPTKPTAVHSVDLTSDDQLKEEEES
jgi:Helix-loop-helix DNA-binding domain